jgi:DnaK suppressor protein
VTGNPCVDSVSQWDCQQNQAVIHCKTGVDLMPIKKISRTKSTVKGKVSVKAKATTKAVSKVKKKPVSVVSKTVKKAATKPSKSTQATRKKVAPKKVATSVKKLAKPVSKTAKAKQKMPKKIAKPVKKAAVVKATKKAAPVRAKAKPVHVAPPSKLIAKSVPKPISKPVPKPKPVLKLVKGSAPKKKSEVKATFTPGLKPVGIILAQVASAHLSTMGVPPYQEKPGEEYMNMNQRNHFRQILNLWRQELMDEVDRTVHHMQDEAANFPDPNDRASQEEEFSLELRARDRERKLIKKIYEALHSMDQDEYGYCDVCGIEIGIRRLEARPTATMCIDCKTLAEIKERQMGGVSVE